MIDISQMNKAEVLQTLFNNSKRQGLGLLHPPRILSLEEAQSLMDTGNRYFDYVDGVVLKIDLSTNQLNTRLYNRDNGHLSAEKALNTLSSHKSRPQ